VTVPREAFLALAAPAPRRVKIGIRNLVCETGRRMAAITSGILPLSAVGSSPYKIPPYGLLAIPSTKPMGLA
jgi:hypothetical protein